MNLENISLNEISRTPRTNSLGSHLCEAPRIGKFIEAESEIELTGSWGWVEGYCLVSTELLFEVMERSGMESGCTMRMY